MNGMVLRILKNSISSLPRGIADAQPLYAPAVAVGQVDDRSRHGHRGEHGGEDAQAMHYREATHRPLAEDEQREAGDQRRHVRVEDRAPGALVAGGDGGLRAPPAPPPPPRAP